MKTFTHHINTVDQNIRFFREKMSRTTFRDCLDCEDTLNFKEASILKCIEKADMHTTIIIFYDAVPEPSKTLASRVEDRDKNLNKRALKQWIQAIWTRKPEMSTWILSWDKWVKNRTDGAHTTWDRCVSQRSELCTNSCQATDKPQYHRLYPGEIDQCIYGLPTIHKNKESPSDP